MSNVVQRQNFLFSSFPSFGICLSEILFIFICSANETSRNCHYCKKEILYLYKPSMARSAVVSRLSSLHVYCPSSSVRTSLMMSLCTLSETCVEYLPPILIGLPFLYHWDLAFGIENWQVSVHVFPSLKVVSWRCRSTAGSISMLKHIF